MQNVNHSNCKMLQSFSAFVCGNDMGVISNYRFYFRRTASMLPGLSTDSVRHLRKWPISDVTVLLGIHFAGVSWSIPI